MPTTMTTANLSVLKGKKVVTGKNIGIALLLDMPGVHFGQSVISEGLKGIITGQIGVGFHQDETMYLGLEVRFGQGCTIIPPDALKLCQ